MLFYPCYLYEFQLYPSFGGGIIEVCAILIKKWRSEARVCPNRTAFSCPCVGAYCIRPYRRPIYGANDPNDRSLIRILVPCGAIGWGVCHTPLP